MQERDKTLFDRAMDRAFELKDGMLNEIDKLVPQAMGQRKLSQREQVKDYLNMTPERLEAMRRDKGDAYAGWYISSMEKLLGRLGG